MAGLQDEQELLRRGQAGDRGAMQCLFLRYKDDLQKYVKAAIGKVPANINDIIQQTIHRTGKDLHAFPLDGDHPFQDGLLSIASDQCARALISMAQTGDMSAVEKLLSMYEEEIKNFLTTRLKAMFRHTDAMEIDAKWHEVRLRAEPKLTGFEYHEKAAFAKYLTTIAVNLCNDQWKRTRPIDDPWLSQLGSMIAGEDPSPSSQAVQKERADALHAAMTKLNSEQFAAVRMELEGKTTTEIAADLNKTPGAVRMLLKRAKENLHKELGSTSLWFSQK